MKESITNLYNLMRLNYEYSEWNRCRALKDKAEDVQNEVREMLEELNKKEFDAEKFRDETGDVFWTLLNLIGAAELSGHFTIKEMLDGAYKKISRRKPFLLEKKKVSSPEEKKIWIKTKELEKSEAESKELRKKEPGAKE